MFDSLIPAAAMFERVRIHIDGTPHDVPAHYSVAAAMLAAGSAACRASAVSGAPRGPFCMMGVCFDCLVEVDGVPNVQGCMTLVSDGMQVRKMHGKARLA
ncbi:MAG: (2Fe-2S)-binding protein [Burkholderia sp.]|jgi:predicted molibdopterin-dependent oxidoreductase YjgC|uniref:(2Fe-2S)-binding protein n=2 Tax=Burkholderiaceae TaxID=119060 RepID=UPI00158D68A3|nr:MULTISPECIES: (2Fe-2S)-binding protein [Burkholderia]MCA3780942.1 (2Fe-2S)-binding protein [Burkholderia sp.]MCA3785120.1 (2Fe-2S)-binding protein [Burkholderia sp.]MCA3791672.1 (2Fe-2S)-binding protein [Burkholderia sp.]MCA3806370.1 (2Fe-2S)-binding protein [Burkholderia sp.]MCA3808352.1 (2Fe-2S)-binding protein [Burkholderia sp.]